MEIISTTGKSLGKITISETSTVKDLKLKISKAFHVQIERQSIRNGPKGKDVKDNVKIETIQLEIPSKIYLKDLGPQIGWDTVFFLEYAGPIFLYGLLFLLPHCFYSSKSVNESPGSDSTNIFPFYLFPIKAVNNLCGGNNLIKVQDTA